LESKVESEPTKNIPSKDYVIARENIENKLVDEFDAKLTSPE
jgi:hypothetical protein